MLPRISLIVVLTILSACDEQQDVELDTGATLVDEVDADEKDLGDWIVCWRACGELVSSGARHQCVRSCMTDLAPL